MTAGIKANLIEVKDVDDQNKNNNVGHDKLSHYDLLIESLGEEDWPPEEMPCFNAMRTVYESAKNATLYGAWMMDTTQVPIGQLFATKFHVGNYDNCVKSQKAFTIDNPDLQTHFCLMEIKLSDDMQAKTFAFSHNTSLETYVNTFTKYKFNPSFMYCGICVPRACKIQSIAKIYRARLRNSHFSSLAEKAKITTRHCVTDEIPQENKTGLYILKFLLAGIVVTAILCTYLIKNNVFSKSFARELASCFCLERNLGSVTKLRDDEIPSMNLIRLISSFIIISGHFILADLQNLSVNNIHVEYMVETSYMKSELAVDTFLTLSGLLYVRGFLNNITQNEFKYLWKRYVRLIVSFLAVMLFYIYAFKDINDGPVWPIYAYKGHNVCKNYLWTNVFMLSSFNVNKLCAPVSWYLACDFQLCLMATILFFIYKRNETVGKYTFVTLFVFLTTLPGVVTYLNNYPAQLFYGFDSLHDMYKNVFFVNLYVLSYHRAAPYMIGMAVGYLVYHYNPANYRKVISKKWSFIGVIFAVWSMGFITDLGGRFSIDYDILEASLYSALNRVVWSIAVSIVVCVSEYGDLPILNDLFNWYPLSVLSRLTYGVYIVHIIFIELAAYSSRSLVTFDILQTSIKAMGVMVFSMIISFFMWMILEAPVINLNNLLLNKLLRVTSNKSLDSKTNSSDVNGNAIDAKNLNHCLREEKKIS